jgi:hypothetical protein
MKFNANYTIQVCQFMPDGFHGIMILDNETGQYLEQEGLEEWVQYVGGKPKKRSIPQSYYSYDDLCKRIDQLFPDHE